MSKCVAIITARGGSKRIYKKNIKEFCGKPIIAYSIQAALESEIFDEVMVSTDDKEIISTYESVLNIINLIYQALDPDKWKDMQISNIFDTDGIEKSKDETYIK